MQDGRYFDSISGLMGYISFFENFVQIVVLLFAWIVVLLAFFILAIQLFVTLIEFKLTTLAGFVLIPFGLFGKTAFAAERVLGNVISSGVKVLVLAVIVGIGSTLFSQFTSGFGGNQPTIENAMALVLAALSTVGSRNLRTRHCQRHCLGRAATRGRCRDRDGAGRRWRDCGWSRPRCRRGRAGRWRIRGCRKGYDGHCEWSRGRVSDAEVCLVLPRRALPLWQVPLRRAAASLGGASNAAVTRAMQILAQPHQGPTGMGAPHEAYANHHA